MGGVRVRTVRWGVAVGLAVGWGMAVAGAEPVGDAPWRRPSDPAPTAPTDLHERLLVLCYHDVPKVVEQDLFAVDRQTFVETIEYLRSHDYRVISLDDVIAAHEGRRPLPERAVLLTFDDGYASFYEFVYPVLRQYGYPAVLAIVSSWIDQPPPNVTQRLMTWEQLREVARGGLVEIASHTHDMHRGLPSNPQGNEAAAMVTRRYDRQGATYEDDRAFQERLRQDLRRSKAILEERLSVPIRAMAWPYGKYNATALAEATQAGFTVAFTLNDRLASVRDLMVIDRVALHKNPTVVEFARELQRYFQSPSHQRILQVDLDLIDDPDPVQTEENLGRFLDRVVALKPSTVYLQAFADPPGDGNIREVYFPNRVLPMRADLFNHVAHRLQDFEIQVYAWMPMLGIVLPDPAEQEALRVREWSQEGPVPSRADGQRLSPFSAAARARLVALYEDLAKHASFDGVLFLDDGYLTDREDFHPEALAVYAGIAGDPSVDPETLTDEQRRRWTAAKIDQLMRLTAELKQAVLQHRPKSSLGPTTSFARTLYATIVTDPESEAWWCQSYARSLAEDDFSVIMAYPRMEGVAHPERWLERLVRIAADHPQGLDKTVFKVQTYDWNADRWIPTTTVHRWLRRLVAAGAHHIGYYPDDCFADQPRAETIRLIMSVEDFPAKRP